MSHTPGPWFYDGAYQIVQEAHTYLRVAILPREPEPPKADGHLIAAAPDMLAALKDAEECLVLYVKGRDPTWPGTATSGSTLGVVRAAIAKAEGKAE